MMLFVSGFLMHCLGYVWTKPLGPSCVDANPLAATLQKLFWYDRLLPVRLGVYLLSNFKPFTVAPVCTSITAWFKLTAPNSMAVHPRVAMTTLSRQAARSRESPRTAVVVRSVMRWPAPLVLHAGWSPTPAVCWYRETHPCLARFCRRHRSVTSMFRMTGCSMYRMSLYTARALNGFRNRSMKSSFSLAAMPRSRSWRGRRHTTQCRLGDINLEGTYVSSYLLTPALVLRLLQLHRVHVPLGTDRGQCC